ncbi:MAG TPA: serine/threonine-protein kinase, partial [Gemmataceae bacterium]|nr:serine/threonine-protein kinase [Gemmataceae bacterium]
MTEKPQGVQGTKKVPTGNPPVKKPAGKPAEIAKVHGKLVRKDSPIGDTVDGQLLESKEMSPARALADAKSRAKAGITSPVAQETIANDPPEQEAPAQSSRQATDESGANKAAASMLGDYKLLKKLGQGGMGAVYKAQQISQNRVVALKVLAKELANKGTFVERFKREARAMQKLDHPNVLRCFDVGEAKGFHFLSMELVDGGSVEGWLKKMGRFSVGDALHIVLKTCEAMQHAHDKTIIHRDIKPDNILLTRDGVIKVADLGLAKDTDEDVSLTKTGAGAGTPIYMAPEQARDVKHVDVRVDIYAIGVMMYVFLTGKAPFEGATLVELIAAKEKGKFDPMRRHNDEVPSRLDLIVDKMIAKDPKQRYASCQEIIDQLEPLGLANERLSFIEIEEQQATLVQTKVAIKQAATKLPQKAAPKPAAKTSAPSNKAVGAATSVEADEPERDVWYWNMVTSEGKIVNKKLSTEQIKALIKAGHLDPSGEISKTMKTGYRPAGTFMEFQGAFKAREAATKANIKGASYKNKMQDLQAEYDSQKRWGGLKRFFSGALGRVFGLLWIVLILGVVGFGGWFVWTR